MGRIFSTGHRVDPPQQGMPSYTWTSGYDPENEICFVAIKRTSMGKYKPIVFALKPTPAGELYWAYLRLGRVYRSKARACVGGRDLATEFRCEFSNSEIRNCDDIVPYSGKMNLEVLSRIILLWKMRRGDLHDIPKQN